MRSPTRTLAANLRWTRSGTVWADFLLSPLAYGYRPTKEKLVMRDLHTGLFRALPGESLLLGVRAGLNPAAVVERMIDGVDLDACPDWAAECSATLDTLDAIGPGQRIFWLSVPLADAKGTAKMSGSLRAATDEVRDMLALPRAGVSPTEIAHRVEQSRKVAEAIPSMFRATPATAAQMVWLDAHCQQRGLFRDDELPETPRSGRVDTATAMLAQSGALLGEPMIDEGAQSDLEGGTRRGWRPWERRYLKITQPENPVLEAASYQSLLVLAGLPTEGMLFPGSEFLGRIDESGLEVDWALRLNIRSSETATAQNRRALIKLNDQYGQRSGEMSHGHNALDRAASDLAEYAGVLESDKLEVEVQATVVFCVAADTAEAVQQQAQALSRYFSSADYRCAQPLGLQEDLWWAFVPGTPTSRSIREFAQITTSRALAAAIPLASTALGDNRGILAGLNISGGPPGAVLHDPAGAAVRDVSGSLGVAGEMGGGKSALLKMLMGGVVDRGGQIIIVDRTQMGEYATWARSITAAVVVDVDDPSWSLDPLRLFGPRAGARIAQSFLTPLTGIKPRSELGQRLGDVLDPDYLAAHDLDGLGDVLTHLQHDCTLERATELASAMNAYARKDFGRVIFDSSLPVVPLDTGAIIVRTHTLQLPRPEEVTHEHLFAEMKLEKVFGRAIYAHIAALARQVCFADTSRLGVFGVDEAHHITSSAEGDQELVEFVRDGRKHNAAVFLGSHDPEADFGSEVLRGLIPTRVVMRHRDKKLAQRSLEWLGLDPHDDDLVTMLTEDTSPVTASGVPEDRRGEAFLRDSSGRIGRIKVLLPSLPARNAAVRTSPPELAETRP